MSAYSISVVLLIPDAQRDLINAYAEALGWGPDAEGNRLNGRAGL